MSYLRVDDHDEFDELAGLEFLASSFDEINVFEFLASNFDEIDSLEFLASSFDELNGLDRSTRPHFRWICRSMRPHSDG